MMKAYDEMNRLQDAKRVRTYKKTKTKKSRKGKIR